MATQFEGKRSPRIERAVKRFQEAAQKLEDAWAAERALRLNPESTLKERMEMRDERLRLERSRNAYHAAMTRAKRAKGE